MAVLLVAVLLYLLAGFALERLRVLQQGKIHVYLICIFAMVALAWMLIHQGWCVS